MQELEHARRVAIVVAHPDDEVIGAGALLSCLKDVWIIHTTDGSPRDPSDAIRNGFTSRTEYAAARRRELFSAMELAAVPTGQAICLGFTDQETQYHLPELCRRLARELSSLKPDAVLTQPYEGGHPDHDSTAFAVRRSWSESAQLFEMTSYHSRNGSLEAGVFLPNGGPAIERNLKPDDAARKEKMLACFASQKPVLQNFPVIPEQFRRAPTYDFTQPPHAGPLHYEQLPWGITGHQWRQMAGRCG